MNTHHFYPVRFWEFTHKMKMPWQTSHCLVYAEWLSQCGHLDCRLSQQCSSSTLCQGNWKWWLSQQVLAQEASACAVCRCKTIFPLVGLPRFKTMSVNVNSKNQTVVNCLQLPDTKRRDVKKWHHLRKDSTLHFYFMGENSKLDWWKQWVLVEKFTAFDEILR